MIERLRSLSLLVNYVKRTLQTIQNRRTLSSDLVIYITPVWIKNSSLFMRDSFRDMLDFVKHYR